MTSYIYLSSDKPFPISELFTDPETGKQRWYYFSSFVIESFAFENNFNPEKQRYFTYSQHFSIGKHQMATANLYLPNRNQYSLTDENKKALQELFHYICNHFEYSQAKFIEILFCRKDMADQPLKRKDFISLLSLSINDLYYEDRKLLRIDTDTADFVCNSQIA